MQELTIEDEWWDGKQVGYCDPMHNIKIALLSPEGYLYTHLFILDTLAHELAHLKHFSHGKNWKKLYILIFKKIKQWIKSINEEGELNDKA